MRDLQSGNVWTQRIRALRNIPPVLRILFEANPTLVSFEAALLLISSVIPVGTLIVTRLVVDSVVGRVSHHLTLRPSFWWLVGAEFGLASMATAIIRLV